MPATVKVKKATKPLTADERRGLQEVDELLKTLIRQNRRLHARVDRLARAVTGLGEPEIDRALKALRKRLHVAPKAGVARTRVAKTIIPRRRTRAA